MGTAKNNTVVHINQTGNYTLEGQATNMCVVVDGGENVNVYLADGLSIDPGAKAHSGKGTAAIEIKDYAGSVNLISNPGASIYLGAYMGHPAVQKNGLSAKLSFDTASTGNPGKITAVASHVGSNCGIGAYGSLTSHSVSGNISFNGGTVIAEGRNGGAGIGASEYSSVDGITINGGAVYATGWKPGGSHQSGQTILGRGAGIGTTYKGTATNITINDGYVVAPGLGTSASSSCAGTTDSVSISGGTVSAQGGSTSTLDIGGYTYTAAMAPVGYTLTGYATARNGGETVIKANGTLSPSSSYVNDKGKWGYTGDSPVALYAQWQGVSYTVAFDDNEPAQASGNVAGTMSDMKFTYGTAQNLASNSYALTGWKFTGWNTVAHPTADSPGISYTDGQSVSDLAAEDGATVVLYAQWEPITYKVKFHAGDGAGEDKTQTLTYDTPTSLTAVADLGYTYGTGLFRGWSGLAFGSQLHMDKEVVVNLASTQDAEVNLYAYWTDNNAVLTVQATLDGAPYEVNSISVYSDTLGAFTSTPSQGLAVFNQLPNGAYRVFYQISRGEQTVDSGIDVTISGNTQQFVVLDFHKLALEGDSHVALLGIGGTSDTPLQYFHETSADISMTAATGYVLDAWVALGATPASWNPTVANQTVTVNDDTTLKATTRAANYTVAFDANTPVNATGAVSGNMADMDFAYDTAQNLSYNSYALTGWKFDGWNTVASPTADNPGTPYADGARVSNLTTEDGAAVKLYAQWTAQEYYITFDDNGGFGLMLDEKMYYDTTAPLSANGFTRENYTFTGWNTADDGSGKAYADEASVSNLTDKAEGSVVLFAQWKHDTYTASYNANGGSGSMEDQTLLCGVDGNLSPCSFTREGYSFAGWNTSANGTGTTYQPDDNILDLVASGQSIQLYAQWSAAPSPDTPSPDTPAADTPAADAAAADTPAASILPDTGDADASPVFFFAMLGCVGFMLAVSCAFAVMRRARVDH